MDHMKSKHSKLSEMTRQNIVQEIEVDTKQNSKKAMKKGSIVISDQSSGSSHRVS
jgi:hypothetical protein